MSNFKAGERITYNSLYRRARTGLPRSHPRYWHLTTLSKQLARIVDGRKTSWGDVLDYGCGNTPYIEIFRNRCVSYTSADLVGNPFASLTLEPCGDIPLPSKSMDSVLSSQVLEHVPDPAQYLAESHRILRADGMLLLSTHGTWQYHPDPRDYWRWTPEGLKREVSRAGFEIVDIVSVLSFPSTALQLLQDASVCKLPQVLWNAGNAAFQFGIGMCEHLAGDRFSSNASAYIVLAAKIG